MKDTKLTHSDLYPIVEILSQCRSVYNLDELDLVVDQLLNSIESLETITLSACFADGQTEVVLGDMSPGTDVFRCLGATDQQPCEIVDPRSAHTVHSWVGTA